MWSLINCSYPHSSPYNQWKLQANFCIQFFVFFQEEKNTIGNSYMFPYSMEHISSSPQNYLSLEMSLTNLQRKKKWKRNNHQSCLLLLSLPDLSFLFLLIFSFLKLIPLPILFYICKDYWLSIIFCLSSISFCWLLFNII